MRTIARTFAVVFALLVLSVLVWAAQRNANPPPSEQAASETPPEVFLPSTKSDEPEVFLPSSKAAPPPIGELVEAVQAEQAAPQQAAPVVP